MDAPGYRKGLWVLVLAGAVMALMAACAAPLSHAASFAVDDTSDSNDSKPGDGFCTTGFEIPSCTLRAAVQESNALPGGDRITVPAGDYHLFLGTALTISGDLEIVGASARTVIVRQLGDIDTGEGTDRVFEVVGGRVTLQRMTITNGRADSRNNHFGGNIRNTSTLDLLEVTVTGGEGNSAGGVANIAGTLGPYGRSMSGWTGPASISVPT